MVDEPSGSAATGRGARSERRGRPRFLLALAGFGLAAVIGGVVGGLIVKATWSSGNGNSGDEPAVESSGPGAACRAANVAEKALPSVVTVRASNGQEGGSGSGVVVRPGG